MTCSGSKKIALVTLALTTAIALVLTPAPRTDAADHRDGPILVGNVGADIGGVYLFLNPSDNTKVIAAMSVNGYIVPAENATAGFFDHTLRYRFQFENTGNAAGDIFLEVTFSKQTSRSAPQGATVKQNGVTLFTASTTVSSSTATTAPPAVITTDPNTGISIFAGLREDPTFFDVPASLRYLNSLTKNAPDPSVFNRARDSGAGYNTLMIVLSIPASRLRGTVGDVIGLSGSTLLGSRQLDRMAVPLVNAMLVPYARKDEYNAAPTTHDAAGKFWADIAQTLTQLHTNSTYIGMIEDLAVTDGDMLRLDLSIPNTGSEGGKNTVAGFPNGRRPNDDVIDTLVTLINNGVPIKDNVNDNDVTLPSTFPFFARPTQPFAAGVTDDRTRN